MSLISRMMEYREFIDKSQDVRTKTHELLEQTWEATLKIMFRYWSGRSDEKLFWRHPHYSLREYIDKLRTQFTAIICLLGFRSPCTGTQKLLVRHIMLRLNELSNDIEKRIRHLLSLYGSDDEDDDDNSGFSQKPDPGGGSHGDALPLPIALAM